MPRTLALANCIYIMYVFYPIHTRFASDIAQKCMSIFKHPSVKKLLILLALRFPDNAPAKIIGKMQLSSF